MGRTKTGLNISIFYIANWSLKQIGL